MLIKQYIMVTVPTSQQSEFPTNLVRGDFHLHTCYSFDCESSLEAIARRCVDVNLNCIAVTDHDEVEGAYRLKELAPFPVIIGTEVSSAEGHIIGLFVKERIKPGLSVPETVERIKEQGGLAIAPHPFSRLADRSLQASYLQYWNLFDAVETANSNNLLRSDDRRAKTFADQHGVLSLTGSDAHLVSGLGSNVVEMKPFQGPQEFLESLKTARCYNKVHGPAYFLRMSGWELKRRFSQLCGRGVPGEVSHA